MQLEHQSTARLRFPCNDLHAALLGHELHYTRVYDSLVYLDQQFTRKLSHDCFSIPNSLKTMNSTNYSAKGKQFWSRNMYIWSGKELRGFTIAKHPQNFQLLQRREFLLGGCWRIGRAGLNAEWYSDWSPHGTEQLCRHLRGKINYITCTL